MKILIFKVRQFISANVLPFLGVGSIAKRKQVSYKYLKGQGIEIGALHFSLPVKKGVTVKYVDAISYEEAVEKFPELSPSKIVKPHYIDDGFTLSTIEENSQDFVIANHVLEHSPNPVGVLINWMRVLKKQGLIYFSVPLAEKCFDRGRVITQVNHLFEDHTLVEQGDAKQFDSRNREHYKEWINISEVNMRHMRGEPSPKLSQEEFQERVNVFSKNKVEIHFHIFSVESIKDFISELEKTLGNLRAIDIVESKTEVIAVLQKAS